MACFEKCQLRDSDACSHGCRIENDADEAGTRRIELERKIRLAYATALHHSHEGGSVQIHVGEAMMEHFKSLVEHPRHPLLNGLVTPRMFGYPLIPIDHADPTHISIHVVHHII